jgi:ketosteroid isomerase-like protein
MYALLATAVLATGSLEQSNAALVKKMFEEVSEKMSVERLGDYFTEDLELTSNNHYMDYAGFKEHLVQAFGALKAVQIKKPYDEFMAKDDKVVTRFTIATTDKKGNRKETGVIAIYQLKDGKISRWWELTYPDWKSDALDLMNDGK